MGVTWPVAMVTGHRPQHLAEPGMLEWVVGELARIVAKLKTEHGTETLISGLALGADQAWGWAAVNQNIALAAHIPFPQQPDVWRDRELTALWQKLVDYAGETGGVTIYGDLTRIDDDRDRKRTAVKLLHARNAGMIDATVLGDGVTVAVLRSSKTGGGTWSAYQKASGRVPIIRVDPDRRTVTLPPLKTRATTNHEQGTLI